MLLAYVKGKFIEIDRVTSDELTVTLADWPTSRLTKAYSRPTSRPTAIFVVIAVQGPMTRPNGRPRTWQLG